jgi:predicted ribonuclease YlaK
MSTTTIEVDVDGGPSKVEDADGEIIQFARRLTVISKRPTLLVTYDLGMRLRAATLGVKAIQLPDEEN